MDTAKPNSEPLTGKIALEEHFVLAETMDTSYAVRDLHPETRQKTLDLGSGRLADMDRGGLDICILSLTAPGVQAVPNVKDAIAQARRTDDYLAESIAKNPKRLKGFATLPLQDPEAAAQELRRCVRDLGFCGAGSSESLSGAWISGHDWVTPLGQKPHRAAVLSPDECTFDRRAGPERVECRSCKGRE